MAGLAAGVYHVVVVSDQSLMGYLKTATPGHADYEIRPSLGQGSSSAFLPRALKNFDDGSGPRSTHLFVANLGTMAGSVTLTYSNGSSSFTHSGIALPAVGFAYLSLTDEAMLSANSAWAVTATSGAASIALGEITDFDSSPHAFSSASYAGIANGTAVDLPYLIHDAGDRSNLSVQNLGAANVTPTIRFYDLSGSLVTTLTPTIQPGAAARINLDSLAHFVGSAAISSPIPIAAYVDLFTPMCTAPANVAISRQPLADLIAGDTVTFTASADGDAPLHYAWKLDSAAAGSDASTYTTHFGAADDHTVGVTVSNTCGQDAASLPANVQALTVSISRSPSGDLYPGDAVQFSATTNSSMTFHYDWMVDSVSAGGNSATLNTSFPDLGSHSVGVTISNAYANASASLPVAVKIHTPDLSTSTIGVNPVSITTSPGETLTYTLTLRNTGLASANAVLTDPIPDHTNLVAPSPNASDGGAVTLLSGALHWSGVIAPAGTVTVTYQVAVQSLQIGEVVTNTATLQDGFGVSTPLKVNSLYNPYFTLSINSGALYTNHNPVSISYTWDTNLDITSVQFSNDGGFGPGPATSGWIAVNQANPVVPDWTLAVLQNTLMPRTVYARFKDSNGKIYGNFADDIIFNSVPPQVSKVEILAGAGLSPASSSHVTIRVTSSDDNSGVDHILVSSDLLFTNPTEFPSSGGAVTDIPWVLQASGNVYVRVCDEAGNFSTVHTQAGPIVTFYLPAVRR